MARRPRPSRDAKSKLSKEELDALIQRNEDMEAAFMDDKDLLEDDVGDEYDPDGPGVPICPGGAQSKRGTVPRPKRAKRMRSAIKRPKKKK
jgi:hypothetical protein